VLDGGKIDSPAKGVHGTRDEDDTRSLARQFGHNELLCKQFGEEERANVVRPYLVLQPVDGELEGADAGGSIVDENRETVIRSELSVRIGIKSSMDRLRAGVNLRSGLANAGER
jgi:hypothetical protein